MPPTMLPRRVLVAPDKFKGTLTAAEAAEAIADGLQEAGIEREGIRTLPIADGGDGTVDVMGGANRFTTVTGPLGEAVVAGWRLDERGVAVIDSASASGLTLAGGSARNDAWSASTTGTGELIKQALAEGAQRVLVGMGGVATTDGGRGALAALEGHVPFEAGRVIILTDTTTTFSDAARVFGPQKGADPATIVRLTARLAADSAEWQERFGVDVSQVPGSGAAGGLAGALEAAGAELEDGAGVIAAHLGLTEAIAKSDLVITGEGSFDDTSLQGKGPGLVIREAAARGVTVLVVAGVVDVCVPPPQALLLSMAETVGHERALAAPVQALRETVLHALTLLPGTG